MLLAICVALDTPVTSLISGNKLRIILRIFIQSQVRRIECFSLYGITSFPWSRHDLSEDFLRLRRMCNDFMFPASRIAILLFRGVDSESLQLSSATIRSWAYGTFAGWFQDHRFTMHICPREEWRKSKCSIILVVVLCIIFVAFLWYALKDIACCGQRLQHV